MFIFPKAVDCARSSSINEDQSKIQSLQITGKVILILKISLNYIGDENRLAKTSFLSYRLQELRRKIKVQNICMQGRQR